VFGCIPSSVCSLPIIGISPRLGRFQTPSGLVALPIFARSSSFRPRSFAVGALIRMRLSGRIELNQ